MANTAINLASLDFDGVKSSLKEYLKSQSRFKDYDFDGSNMSVLLDVLAYNTYLNGFYLNMVASEQFLDSAQLRDSVVSHAKMLNYVPESASSPVARVNVTFSTTGITDNFTIPKGTQFSGTNANGGFTFVTDRNLVASSSNSTFTFTDVELYEGSYFNDTFSVDYSIEGQRFILSNPGIDTTSLTVEVSEDFGATRTEYPRATTLYRVDDETRAYFLQAASNGRYELVFGDGVLGYRPPTGSIVYASYRVTSGVRGAGVNKFYLGADLGGINGGQASVASIATVLPASDGADAESIESIRYRAPRAYQTQERAVTVDDYKSLVFVNFPEVKDVSVYGGEEVTDAVAYGTVYISCTTFSGNPLTAQRKNELISFLRDKRVLSVQNIVVDPQYLYVVPSTVVTADFSDTTKTPAQVRVAVMNASAAYNDSALETFGGDFRLSRYLQTLNSADSSIVSSTVETTVYKLVTPETGVEQSFSVTFNNELEVGSISSSTFLTADGNTYQLTDLNPFVNSFYREVVNGGYVTRNRTPVIYLKRITTDNTQSYSEVGAVDYSTGLITVRNVNVVDFYSEGGIRISARTTHDDVFSTLNDVVLIDSSRMTVDVESV